MRLPFLDVGWHKLLKTLRVDRHLDRNAIETRIYDYVSTVIIIIVRNNRMDKLLLLTTPFE